MIARLELGDAGTDRAHNAGAFVAEHLGKLGLVIGVAAVQVILAAIAKSDGSRQSVVNQVFSGSGIDIPASQSVLGKEIKIDPQTGDTNNKDISILFMKGNQETYLKGQPVT